MARITDRVDWSVYVLLDMSILAEQQVQEVAAAVLAGGATALQLRAKGWAARRLVELAGVLLPLARASGVPLLINDHADIALAVGADGVHLGADDLPVALARRILPEAIVGCSPEGAADARRAEAAGADYLGVGPFAATSTKPDAGSTIGPAGIEQIVAAVSIPVVAVGGLTAANAPAAIVAGAVGVALASSVIAAPDPAAATRMVRSAVSQSLARAR